MTFPKCQVENREKAQFCKKCGAKLEFSCPACGTVNTPDSKFCDGCSQALTSTPPTPLDLSTPHSSTPKFLADKTLTSRSTMEGERKLVAVLFADVATFTPLSERLDPWMTLLQKKVTSWTMDQEAAPLRRTAPEQVVQPPSRLGHTPHSAHAQNAPVAGRERPSHCDGHRRDRGIAPSGFPLGWHSTRISSTHWQSLFLS